MRILALALTLAALTSVSGCSWLFVEGPPAGHERLRYFECTTSRAAPIGDTALATVYGLTTLAVLTMGGIAVDGDGSDHDDGDLAMMLIPGAAATVAFGISAAHGFNTTEECDDAKARWAKRTRIDAPSAPGTLRACGSDADCAGDRICKQGTCVFPPVPISPPAPTLPAELAPRPTMPAPSPSPSPPPAVTPPPSPPAPAP